MSRQGSSSSDCVRSGVHHVALQSGVLYGLSGLYMFFSTVSEAERGKLCSVSGFIAVYFDPYILDCGTCTRIYH
jgi:hypothetical protein